MSSPPPSVPPTLAPSDEGGAGAGAGAGSGGRSVSTSASPPQPPPSTSTSALTSSASSSPPSTSSVPAPVRTSSLGRRSSALPPPPVPGTPSYSQHLKDLALFLEYKTLKRKAPGGVYVLPSEEPRVWDGVLFLRQGLYRGAVFKFFITIPAEYPEDGARPGVTFTTPVYHPLVAAASGVLQLDGEFPQWVSSKHNLVAVVKFIKRVFYLSDYNSPHATNTRAMRAWNDDRDAFVEAASASATASQKTVTVPPHEHASLKFSDPKPAHDAIRTLVLDPDAKRKNFLDLVTRGVSVDSQ